MWNGIGAVTDKELKLEDGDASHTLGGAGDRNIRHVPLLA